MTEPVAQKETKAQRTERLKLEKNPWQAFDEVRAFAREDAKRRRFVSEARRQSQLIAGSEDEAEVMRWIQDVSAIEGKR